MTEISKDLAKKKPILTIVSSKKSGVDSTKLDKACANNQEKNTSSRCFKKRPFEGFHQDDIDITKRVQDLYSAMYTSEGKTQALVAAKVGWSQSTLNQYINGQQRIGDKALRKFCELLQVSPYEINPNYPASKINKDNSGEKHLQELKDILSELVEAIDGKRDLKMLVMKAKSTVGN